MTIYITRNCKVIELTEAEFLAAYNTNRIQVDEKVNFDVDIYYIELTAKECYFTILEAYSRTFDRKLVYVDES